MLLSELLSSNFTLTTINYSKHPNIYGYLAYNYIESIGLRMILEALKNNSSITYMCLCNFWIQ